MKMRKMLLPCLLCIISLGSSRSSGVDSELIDFNGIRVEIEWFINKVKPKSIEQGKYNVYLLKLYTDGSNRYCATVGYIMDSLWISQIRGFKHFTRVKGELVLLQYSSYFKNKLDLEKNGIELLTDTRIVAHKIQPGAWIVGTTPGYVCCFDAGNIVKIYYDDSDEIPYDKKVFSYLPQGDVLHLDSTQMKPVFKRKRN